MEHGDRLVSRSTRRAGRAVGTGRGWGIAAWTAAAAIPLAFLAVFFLLPVLSLIATGFTTEGRFDASGIPAVLGEPRTWSVVGQTLAQAALGTLLSLVLGVPAAFVLYRLRFRGRAALRGLMTVPFV
ncbi:iron ABC transporter permease, partial [Leucobacter sp. OLES1]